MKIIKKEHKLLYSFCDKNYGAIIFGQSNDEVKMKYVYIQTLEKSKSQSNCDVYQAISQVT